MQDLSRLGLVLLCSAIILLCCAGAPGRPLTVGRGDYTRTQQDIAGLIEQTMQKNRVTGLSIALVDDQQVVWAQGFGYADETNNIPATPETVYRVGSLSELFTATAALQLAEQGKIALDRPLQTYLPEFSIKRRFIDPKPITLRHLMSHLGLSHTTLAGRELLIARNGTQAFLMGEKITPAPVPDVWQQRVGAYAIVNRGNDTVAFDDVQLRYHEGFLVVDYTVPLLVEGTMSLVLEPISDTEAVTRGLGRGMGETLRVVTVNGQDSLQYSGYLLQRKAR